MVGFLRLTEFLGGTGLATSENRAYSTPHASLDGKTPAEMSGNVVTHPVTLRNFTWEKHCGGLFFELPVAA